MSSPSRVKNRLGSGGNGKNEENESHAEPCRSLSTKPRIKYGVPGIHPYSREKYLKSGMGKRYLKNRLKRFLSLTGSMVPPETKSKKPIGFRREPEK
jgi:hypothetical protein